MRDATEYQFVNGDRRLLVRRAEPGADSVDLQTAAREYAQQLEDFLRAADVSVSKVTVTPPGGEAVRVRATLPDGLLRAALLRFPGGPLVELALTTSPYDRAADAEFERVLASARPTLVEPTEVVGLAVAAGPRGSAGYPAGPLVLDLPDTYTTPPVFALASDDDRERYTLERAEGGEGGVRNATSPALTADLSTAVGEDGLPVKFEVPPTDRARVFGAAAAAAPLSATPISDDASSAAVRGTVRGAGVRVRFAGQASAESAKQLIRTLNGSN
jgi:hypothetical protein